MIGEVAIMRLEEIVCNAVMIAAPATIGSCARCGMAACAPFPCTRMQKFVIAHMV